MSNRQETLQKALDHNGLTGVHHAAEVFPLIADEDYESLKKSLHMK